MTKAKKAKIKTIVITALVVIVVLPELLFGLAVNGASYWVDVFNKLFKQSLKNG